VCAQATSRDPAHSAAIRNPDIIEKILLSPFHAAQLAAAQNVMSKNVLARRRVM
jgi:hypothetical protein